LHLKKSWSLTRKDGMLLLALLAASIW